MWLILTCSIIVFIFMNCLDAKACLYLDVEACFLLSSSFFALLHIVCAVHRSMLNYKAFWLFSNYTLLSNCTVLKTEMTREHSKHLIVILISVIRMTDLLLQPAKVWNYASFSHLELPPHEDLSLFWPKHHTQPVDENLSDARYMGLRLISYFAMQSLHDWAIMATWCPLIAMHEHHNDDEIYIGYSAGGM